MLFAPKYRRKLIYGQLKRDIANILSMLCKRKGAKIVEAEVCPDHIHMLVEIPPSISVSGFVGYLKGYNGEWKFGAIGQGTRDGGIGEMAARFQK